MALGQYLQYMQEVLGIRQVFLSQERQTQVLFIDKSPWSPGAQELFSKMREAMRLREEDIKILFTDRVPAADIQLLSRQSREIVSFDVESFEMLKKDFSSQLTLTISPEKLLKDSTQKKAAWVDLQSVMKRLN